MYDQEISEHLQKTLKKLFVKDKRRYEATLNKIEEVINSQDVNHYKNLRYDLKAFKRIHIDSSFVLIFKVENNTIKFEDLQHHDEIYERK